MTDLLRFGQLPLMQFLKEVKSSIRIFKRVLKLDEYAIIAACAAASFNSYLFGGECKKMPSCKN